MSAPLSHLQHRYLLDAKTGWSNFTVSLCWDLRGPLDAQALDRAWRRLVERHDALRTRLVAEGDRWGQTVTDDGGPALELTEPAEDRDERAILELVRSLADRPLDVRGAALVRAQLIRWSTGRAILVLLAHHLVMDGVSTEVLFGELPELYRSELEGGAGLDPVSEHTALDHAREDRRPLEPGVRAFWRGALAAGPTAADAPSRGWLDEPKRLRCHEGPLLSAATMEALRARARAARLPLFAVVLAGVARAAPVADPDHVTCAVVHANRARPGSERTVGLIADFLPVRIETGGDPSFAALARRASDGWRQSLLHPATLGAINAELDGSAEWPAATVYHLSVNYTPRVRPRPQPAIDDLARRGLTVSRLVLPFHLRRIEVHRWACGSYPFEFNLVEQPDGALSIRVLRVGDVMTRASSLARAAHLHDVLADAATRSDLGYFSAAGHAIR